MTSGLRNLLVIGTLSAAMAVQAPSQGTFQNLNFESAVLVPVPGGPLGAVQ